MSRSLRGLAGSLVLALTCGVLGAAVPASAAAAAPLQAPASTASASSDASLSDFGLSAPEISSLAPGFDPQVHDYQVVVRDASQLSVVPTPAAGDATAVVTRDGTAYPLASGTATVPLTRGRNDVKVTVTAADGVTTEAYRLTVWRNVAPTPRIVSVAGSEVSSYGGDRVTVTAAHATMPDRCSISASASMSYASIEARSFDRATGYTKLVVEVGGTEGSKAVGPQDLVLTTGCSFGSWPYNENWTASATAADALTFVDDFKVESAKIPATVTAGSKLVLQGPGVNNRSDVEYVIVSEDGDEDQEIYLNAWDVAWQGVDTAALYVPYSYDDERYNVSGPRMLVARTWVWEKGKGYSARTHWSAPLTWAPPAPSDITISPVYGSVSGGTKVRMQGRFLASGVDRLSIKVGSKTVTDYTVRSAAQYGYGGDTDAQFSGRDIIEFVAPAGVAGTAQVSATSSYGTGVARGSFTYVAKPTITTVAPERVANTGGSVITVAGTSFGTTGRPTVIIGGEKSPYVTRVNDRKLTAVVPALPGVTGATELTVTSSQGGGTSAPATLTLTGPAASPSISKVTPAAGVPGTEVTVTGAGFGAAGTVGVSVDGVWARVLSSSATGVTFEVPSTDGPGAKDLVVAATTGAVTRAAGFTVQAENAITSVAPATVPSYATGDAATVTLVGAGFGTTGTVKVGSAAAKPYTAIAGGTKIEGVAVPTGTAGVLAVVVTPARATSPLQSSVRVSGPIVSYVGSDPRSEAYADPTGGTQLRLAFHVETTGGTTVRVEGSGFGPAGSVTVDGAPAAVLSWTDTAVVLSAPAKQTEGLASLTLTPAGSTLSATREAAVRYVPVADRPSIKRILSNVDLGHSNRNEFHAIDDSSDLFTLVGENLAGATAAATRVTVSYERSFEIEPVDITETSLVFRAPRSFTTGGWKNVAVTTDLGTASVSNGIHYLDGGVQFTQSPDAGSCVRTPMNGTGGVTHTPAVVTLSNNAGAFGASGTVTVAGVPVTPSSYSATSVTISMASLEQELDDPWGPKTIVVTPTDASRAPQSYTFNCAVPLDVATTANTSTAHLTVPAGTDYTLSATANGLVEDDTFEVTDPTSFQYVTAEDYGRDLFDRNIRVGKPVAAGDYYVRVAAHEASYDKTRYLAEVAPVRVTLTGTAITFTPISENGSTFTYKGALTGDAPGTEADFTYTASPAPADPITAVQWEFRHAGCTATGWNPGLPKDVAVAGMGCGGGGTTTGSWDVRVRSFQMAESGTDRSLYYRPTYETIRVTVTPRPVTATAARADRTYDGTTTANVDSVTLDGLIDGDGVRAQNDNASATFATPDAGVDKPVTLSRDLRLVNGYYQNYTLTNPRPTIVGTISKADVSLSLAVSARSVVLSGERTVGVTAVVRNNGNNAVVDASTGAAPVVLTSTTPDVCTLSGSTVTAKRAGTCVIAGRQAASTNYNAATAASDPSSTEESVEIEVFPAPQTITVVADDLAFSVEETVEPSAQVSGLFDGDEVTDVQFDYYKGSTLLASTPTEVGTYKVVPKAGTLQASNPAAYTNANAFRYVAGTLAITGLPAVVTTLSPASGPVAGGTPVTVTGKRLDTVTAVRVGEVTLRRPAFTVNAEGTRLTFKTPKAEASGLTTITLVAGTASVEEPFTYTGTVPAPKPPAPPAPKPTPKPTPPAPKPAPVKLDLKLNLKLDAKVAGAKAGLSGSGLKPRSSYVLEMHSKVVVLARGTTNAKGVFNAKVTIPKKACIKGGLHKLVLKGTTPAGKVVQDVKWVAFDDACTTRGVSDTKPTSKKPLVSKWFTFGHVSAKLTPQARKALNALAPSLRGAKTVTITGYTQTQNQSKASIAANKKLAKKRAEAVKSYLKSRGVKARIVTVGKGPVDPVSRTKQHLNRRVIVEARY
jgi:outer membrane protein OmpA-like peptidoglycan-associated protein